MPPYVLVSGHGRSGTNWLVDILDASPKTHCRNEPNEVPGSSLELLQSLWDSPNALDAIANRWEQQVAIAKISTSERDHHIATSKEHLYALSQTLGLASFPVRPKFRKILSLFFRELRQGEWIVPQWIASTSSVEQSCAIFKINMLAAWFVNWHVEQYPERPVLHIVRHPGGYLNSSISRFFSKRTPSQLEREHHKYRTMLKIALLNAPEWGDILGDIESMDLLETVMWCWRMNNEMIYSESRNHENYRLLIYEEMVQTPLEMSKQIYDFCGLPWTSLIESSITSGLNESVWGPLSSSPRNTSDAWKQKLSAEYQELVHKILDDSDMKVWWPS